MGKQQPVPELSPQHYARADVQFPSQDEFLEAISRIASTTNVVIYCGAGVTIDQTGLGWSDLVQKGLRPQKTTEKPYVDMRTAEVLNQTIGPQQLATVMRHFFKERYDADDGSANQDEIQVNTDLSHYLYAGHSQWSGKLSDKIADYAVTTATRGGRVTIITTNYDVYVERSIVEHLTINGDKGLPAPELTVSVAGEGTVRRVLPSVDAVGTASILMIYVHGRIDQDEGAQGDVVLDEVDYALSHNRTVQILAHHFALPQTTVIMVGSSLTDWPLIETLATTVPVGSMSRYAVIPVTSTGFTIYGSDIMTDLVGCYEARLKRLGTTLLMPDFHVQIQQFFQELTVAKSSVNPLDYQTKEYQERFGNRLVKWWGSWIVKASDPKRVASQSHNLLEKVKGIRHAYIRRTGEASKELLKLEVWVRNEPASGKRRLALWVSSLGPLIDWSILRVEEISLESNQASMMAFTEGRPLHRNRDEILRHGSRDPTAPGTTYSRWQSFLSVPIYSEVVKMYLGVVTLASTFRKEETGIPTNSSRQMVDLITDMELLGLSVVAVSPAEGARPAAH